MKITTIILFFLVLNLNTYAEVKKEYYPNGDIKREIEYTDGKKDGVSKFYLEGKQLLAKANYKKGVRDGFYLEYDKKGNIKLKDIYANGEPVGRRLYYKDGKPLDGTFKTPTPNGENIDTYKQGVVYGIQRRCKAKDECTKQIVREDGTVSYNSISINGKILEEGHYKNGKLEGEFSRYDIKNGNLTTRSLYKNGLKDGLKTTYYRNGKRRTETVYHNGLIKVDTITYNKDGSIKQMTNPYNGVYSFDISKIENTHILNDIERSKSLKTDTFQLRIDESLASIMGFQTGQPIRRRLYTSCVLKNGNLELLNTTGNDNEDYCAKPPQTEYITLKFKKDNKSQRRLICENCEEYGFPPVWFR